MERQNAKKIQVIIGNPPWSIGQASQNDDNQNREYPVLRNRIARTYVAESDAGLQRALYDKYIQAIRMASDRVTESEDGGVVAFVVNNGFIEGEAAAGLRKRLTKEFHEVYCLNLRGNLRKGSTEEGENIFNRKTELGRPARAVTRAGIAILMLVKKPGEVKRQGKLYYRDTADGLLSREEKIGFLNENCKSSAGWREITPDKHGDWINQRAPDFENLIPLYGEDGSVFNLDSLGVVTNRDAWVHNFSREVLQDNTARMMAFFNANIPTANPNWSKSDFKRTRKSDRRAKNGGRLEHDPRKIVPSMYRVFCKQHAYFDRSVVEEVYQQPRIYPDSEHENFGIAISDKDKNNPFSCLATGVLPNLSTLGRSTRYLPFSTYTANAKGGYDAANNISPAALALFRERLGAESINESDLFCYVYGVLHHPEYRSRYAANLRKEAARVPMPDSSENFRAFRQAGYELGDLHLKYESAEPYRLEEEWRGSPRIEDRFRVGTRKMRHPGNRSRGTLDETALIYNEYLTLRGIPPEAHRYVVGQYSALRWLMERYHIKTDKDSCIVNDPNAWSDEVGDPRYILDLVKRVITVSVDTMRIIDGLPPLSGID